MKTYTKIFGKLFAQIWILILASLVFTYGVLLLTDLKNYELIPVNESTKTFNYFDENDNFKYINVKFSCKYEFRYRRDFHSFYSIKGTMVNKYSEYKVISADYYIDVYRKENGKYVLLETVSGDTYEKKFYDVEKGSGFKIIARVENAKYEYPAWRYYVPIAIFVFTLPVMGLTGYNAVIETITLIKRKKESEMPVIDKYM